MNTTTEYKRTVIEQSISMKKQIETALSKLETKKRGLQSELSRINQVIRALGDDEHLPIDLQVRTRQGKHGESFRYTQTPKCAPQTLYVSAINEVTKRFKGSVMRYDDMVAILENLGLARCKSVVYTYLKYLRDKGTITPTGATSGEYIVSSESQETALPVEKHPDDDDGTRIHIVDGVVTTEGGQDRGYGR